MTHAEFVAAHREGKLSVHVDPKAAARLVSSRMMLPLILLPAFGIAVALTLTGYLITGILLFAAALAFRYAIRRSSRGFVLTRALEDAGFYQQVVAAGVLSYSRDSS
jgi:hypothetical protein